MLLTNDLFIINGTSNVLILYPTIQVFEFFEIFLLINVKKSLMICASLVSDENENVINSSFLNPPQVITTILAYSE